MIDAVRYLSDWLHVTNMKTNKKTVRKAYEPVDVNVRQQWLSNLSEQVLEEDENLLFHSRWAIGTSQSVKCLQNFMLESRSHVCNWNTCSFCHFQITEIKWTMFRVFPLQLLIVSHPFSHMHKAFSLKFTLKILLCTIVLTLWVVEAVVPKLFQGVTQIKVVIVSHYLQCFAL